MYINNISTNDTEENIKVGSYLIVEISINGQVEPPCELHVVDKPLGSYLEDNEASINGTMVKSLIDKKSDTIYYSIGENKFVVRLLAIH
ncbi:MAG: hypothetical protein N2749_01735 [Clostridia bacterium]|nr:hypothetical protein [Clostridia bacterium]